MGTSLYDTTTFSGVTTGFTPTASDVSYQFNSVAAGSGLQSNTSAARWGSYGYAVTFAGDSNYNAITTAVNEPLEIDKGTLTLSTTIYNATTNAALPLTGTGGAADAALARACDDTTTFSGVTTGFTPTASDVSYQFNSVAAGSGLQSNTSAGLGSGSYGYAVTFAGHSNYNAITTAVNEPLQIDKGTLTLSTTIYNATTNAAPPLTGMGGAADVALGTSVYDTTTFSGVTTGFTPTASDVSYQFNSVAAGSGLQSNTSGVLGAGSYGYAVTFAGDSNYNAITTAVNEPLQIDKGTLTLSTTIYNATTNAAPPLTGTGGAADAALGTSVYDTTTFSGVTTGFTPTASDVGYQFNSVAAGSGLQSNTSACWAGSDGYAVTFAGDSNYNAITTAVNEPLQSTRARSRSAPRFTTPRPMRRCP